MINNNIFLLILFSIVSIILIKIIYKWYIRTNNIVNKQNIVILGLSRTGTSSMCEALRILGNEVWHFTYLKPKTGHLSPLFSNIFLMSSLVRSNGTFAKDALFLKFANN